MANDEQRDRGPTPNGIDLPDGGRKSGVADRGDSSLLNIRTLAAGITGAVVASLILGAVVLFLRSDDNAPIQVLLSTSTPTPNSLNASNRAATALPQEMKVYVTGAVVNPGVYALPPGDRVSDAITAAGGATIDAQKESVNLALRVQDEGHYHIPRLGESLPSADATTGFQDNQTTGTVALGICDGLIDLNTASVELLETLPNIGQVRAAAVVSYREKNGGFHSVEEITNVSGIGPATYEAIRELATA
ncbi:MAG: hypothetical protein BZY75_06005 [SAR202 cluster bacterium Io17-Chloro-G7]|nr:MAG: hypothetical protein BZY75_06005 [SAR202 cluster bacterium Io17-Chloro-G7]